MARTAGVYRWQLYEQLCAHALGLGAYQLGDCSSAGRFFYQLSRIFVSLFAGILVDRANRKHLMLLGDAIAAATTLFILVFYLLGALTVWHLYLAASVQGGFSQIQELAYSTSVTQLVSAKNYTRANSMSSAVHYGSNIVAPALAGTLYPIIGLSGILPIDLVIFAVATATLTGVQIPQVKPEEAKENSERQPPRPEKLTTKISSMWNELTFGIRYIWQRNSLRSLLWVTALFWFAHDLGGAIHSPMILARSGNNAQVLGAIATAAGMSGVTGAAILSTWGGPKQRVKAMLAGFIGAGLSKTIFGLGRSLQVWGPRSSVLL